MNLRYKCLILDHDDTMVDTIPAFSIPWPGAVPG